jgi:hypothetical protein
MDVEVIEERWELVGGREFLGFEKVQNKRSNRPDLHAFLLLDRLFPGKKDIVSAAEHDKIYLDIEGDQIAILSDDEIIELSRCGVMYDGENDCLCMFA